MYAQILVGFLAFSLCADVHALDYTCGETNGEPNREFTVNNVTYLCQEGLVCNSMKIVTGVCVKLDDICGKTTAQYRCSADLDDAKTVVLEGKFEAKCYDGFVCNRKFKYPCKPCIPETCNKEWQCSGPTDRHVVYMGLQLTCKINSKCNQNKTPCSPCVSRATGRATNLLH